MTLSARLVLLLRDECSGQVIMNHACLFRLDNRYLQPLRKPEGYYVFGGVPPKPFELEIRCAGYAAQTMTVYPDRLEPHSPILTIRLLRSYPAFHDCEWVHGEQLLPGEPFFVCLTGETLKLQSFSNGDVPTVSFLGSPEKPLDGIRCLIGEGQEMETIVFLNKQADGLYTIAAPPIHPHNTGDAIMRISLSISDEKGCCHIPVQSGYGSQIKQLQGDWEEGCAWGRLSVTGLCLPVALEWRRHH